MKLHISGCSGRVVADVAVVVLVVVVVAAAGLVAEEEVGVGVVLDISRSSTIYITAVQQLVSPAFNRLHVDLQS